MPIVGQYVDYGDLVIYSFNMGLNHEAFMSNPSYRVIKVAGYFNPSRLSEVLIANHLDAFRRFNSQVSDGYLQSKGVNPLDQHQTN